MIASRRLTFAFLTESRRSRSRMCSCRVAPIESSRRKQLMLISHRTLCNIDDGWTSERRHLLSRPSSSWPHPSFFQALSCATHVVGVRSVCTLGVCARCVNSFRRTCACISLEILPSRLFPVSGYWIVFHTVLTRRILKLRCDDLAGPLKRLPHSRPQGGNGFCKKFTLACVQAMRMYLWAL